MIDTKALRRLAQAALIGPDGVSMRWLKLLKDFQEEANPSEVLKILDRLEAAEKERDDVAQQLVQSEQGKRKISEECDELRAELETERMRLAACGVVALANTPDSAKRARDMRSEYWSASCEDVARMVDQNIELRAKITEMEKQEPYAFAVNFPETSRVELVRDLDEVYEDLIYEAHEVRKLYTLPGAKGEEK